jgi:hypothetical protein
MIAAAKGDASPAEPVRSLMIVLRIVLYFCKISDRIAYFSLKLVVAVENV